MSVLRDQQEAAAPGPLDQREHLARLDQQDRLVLPGRVLLALLEILGHKVSQVRREKREVLDKSVQQEPQDKEHKALKGTRVIWGRLVRLASKEAKGTKALRGSKETRGIKVLREAKVIVGHRDRESATLDQRVLRECKESRVRLEHKVIVEHKDFKEFRDFKALRVDPRVSIRRQMPD